MSWKSHTAIGLIALVLGAIGGCIGHKSAKRPYQIDIVDQNKAVIKYNVGRDIVNVRPVYSPHAGTSSYLIEGLQETRDEAAELRKYGIKR